MKWSDYLFTMIFVVTVAGAFFVLIPMYTEYQNARAESQRLRQEVLRRELQTHQFRQELRALKNDPAVIERVAREKLGWCREDEKIYHFETTGSEED